MREVVDSFLQKQRYVKVTFCVLIKLKDTYKENTPSYKTQALTKSMNLDIYIVGTLDQHFTVGSNSEIKFSKIKVVNCKTLVF